jgi:hypothetical protein
VILRNVPEGPAEGTINHEPVTDFGVSA